MSELLDRWQETGQWPPSPEPKGGWTPPRLYDAIAAEVRSEIAEKVAALPGMDVQRTREAPPLDAGFEGRFSMPPAVITVRTGEGTLVDRAAVLAILEGSDAKD